MTSVHKFSKTLLLWGVGGIVISYSALIAVLIIPAVQTFGLYGNFFHTAKWTNLDDASNWGFEKAQVVPFTIETPDREVLYAWHILPRKQYKENAAELRQASEEPASSSRRSARALELLRDTQSRLIISFHGNTGHLAQAQRPAHYKALLDTDPDNTHILAVDYRGFGLSTGAPSEAGLITDGIATVNWALEKAGVSPERMVLVGNSLGTGVATATMEHFAVHASPPVPIRALVLLSGFANIPTLMKTYMIGGVVPVLSPLNTYPDLQKWIGEHVVDTWDSARRLTSIAKSGSKFNLVLVHARDDWDIVWKHSVLLYHAVVDQWVGRYDECRAATGKDDDEYQAAEYETGTVRKHLFDHGGHRKLITYHDIARIVHDTF